MNEYIELHMMNFYFNLEFRLSYKKIYIWKKKKTLCLKYKTIILMLFDFTNPTIHSCAQE